MKIRIAAISMLTFAFFNAGAQKLHLGIKGGANVNKITGQSFDQKFSFGYHVGAFAEIGLGKKFAIQPEVLLNQTNLDTSTKISSIYTINKVSSVQLKYISIPLLLNYQVSKALVIQAGPQYGIILDKNSTLLQNGKTAFKSGDFSLLGGLQLKFSNFRLYGRYAVGLSNINDINTVDKWKTQTIQVGLGFTLL